MKRLIDFVVGCISGGGFEWESCRGAKKVGRQIDKKVGRTGGISRSLSYLHFLTVP